MIVQLLPNWPKGSTKVGMLGDGEAGLQLNLGGDYVIPVMGHILPLCGSGTDLLLINAQRTHTYFIL